MRLYIQKALTSAEDAIEALENQNPQEAEACLEMALWHLRQRQRAIHKRREKAAALADEIPLPGGPHHG